MEFYVPSEWHIEFRSDNRDFPLRPESSPADSGHSSTFGRRVEGFLAYLSGQSVGLRPRNISMHPKRGSLDNGNRAPS